MARSFSSIKAISVFVYGEISLLSRRGLATGSQIATSTGVNNGSQNIMLKKTSEEAAKTAWVPDPETGFYRPENHTKESDPAELRALLINNRNNRTV